MKRDSMPWIEIAEYAPRAGEIVLCRLSNYCDRDTQEVLLKRVKEDDCNWRTADDNSPLNYDWHVTHWREVNSEG